MTGNRRETGGNSTEQGAERNRPRPVVDVFARLEELDPGFRRPRPSQLPEPPLASPMDSLLHAIRDENPEVRADAAEALGHLGDKAAWEPLRALLRDPDGEVRTEAAVALIRIGDQELFPEVVKSLRHGDPRVVIGAAVALGRLADPRVVPNLVEAFKTDNAEVGAAVAWALGQCGDAAALPWLMTAVEQGFASANACEALGRIGDPRAQSVLLKALTAPADDVRAYAARALGLLQIGGGKGLLSRATRMAENKAVPALKRLLQDRSRKVRLCAAIALHELGERGGRVAVASVLNGE